MRDIAKVIQILLPDGNARSIRIAEITSRTVQATLIPRAALAYAERREEVKRAGAYFLFGEEEASKPVCYIGEGEDCLDRVKSHHRTKDFWNTAVIITSKTDSYTKTHGKYLEWYCTDLARKVGRYQLDNAIEPKKPKVTEVIEAELNDNLDTIKVLLSTYGYPVLEEVSIPSKKKPLFYCKSKNADSSGVYTDEGFQVLKGSRFSTHPAPSWEGKSRAIRNSLIQDGILVQEENHHLLTEDYLFSSPSNAAAAVLARSANGWTEWKNDKGQTLDQVIRQE